MLGQLVNLCFEHHECQSDALYLLVAECAALHASYSLSFEQLPQELDKCQNQLRQPLLLTDGVGVIGSAPVEGVLHPKNVLDTLGADAPESACKPT